MNLTIFTTPATFGEKILDRLLENEVQNSMLISFANDRESDSSGRLMAAVTDCNGAVLLTAACTPPYKIVLYETGNRSQ